MEYFENRDRAESFGEVAQDYDAFRPKYPAALVAAIMEAAEASAGPGTRAPRILDVGSGTGILASQLRTAGAEILAVEPDPAMAELTRSKGFEVEVSAFEDWDPQSRTFDLVSFGQSFHWVDPAVALPTIRTVLTPGGTLALAWNDIEPIGELKTRLDATAARFHTDGRTASLGAAGAEDTFAHVEHPAIAQLSDAGFTPTEATFVDDLHYSKHEWLSMVFTYSAQLTMDPVKRAVMREEMSAEIPDGGLDARNEALLVLASA